MGKRTKAAIWTMIISIINSLCIVALNLVYNNYVIHVYGSNVNGLISTLMQFVSLFSVIESGFTTASIVAVYAPIVNKDREMLNDILYTTQKTYLKIGSTITIAVLIAGSVYLLFIDSPLTYHETFLLLILTVMTTAFSLCFLSRNTVLLQGDNKEYVLILASLIAKLVTWIISIVFILLNVNVILVYSINVLNVFLNVLFVALFVRKKYPFVNYKGDYKKEYIKGTGDVLFQRVANTVFTSTDLILISVCINLAYASVYNLYFQVFRSVLTLLTSFAQSPVNSFGQLYGEGDIGKKFHHYFNIYQHLILLTSSIILTVTGVMIIPFVKVYSRSFSDFDYVYPSLALLFFSQIFAQIINRPYGTILNVSGNFKMQNMQCGSAALVNMIISVAFIKLLGIDSIILGSFVGTLIILFMNMYQAYKKVLCISPRKPIFNIIINYCVAMLIIVISLKIDYECRDYVRLIWMTASCSVAICAGLISINYLVDQKSTRDVFVFSKGLFLKRINSDYRWSQDEH